MNSVNHEDNIQDRIYLPPLDNGVDRQEFLNRYVKDEFPYKNCNIYSIPNYFNEVGEKQARLAERMVFIRLKQMKLDGLWLLFFHNACYGGKFYRNQRIGKLMIREHDFVVFATYAGKYYVILLEVKSTNDYNTKILNLEKVSDSKLIKNNKRSAQHQLRDHIEIIGRYLNNESITDQVQCYIMWPFLDANTRDFKQQKMRRWKEDKDLHVFEDTISDQLKFDQWFEQTVLKSATIDEAHFITLLNRYIILSCGVFVNEINENMLALMTQDQMRLLNNDLKHSQQPIIIHGVAGTGKTLLVLRKLEQLYHNGQLNDENRALYICYWPGIRCEMQIKLKKLGLDKYVDTKRFYISLHRFPREICARYKHIFMDEAEALYLSFDLSITRNTLNEIFRCYHSVNCPIPGCRKHTIDDLKHHDTRDWGQLWFNVDVNQALIFLPQHSLDLFKRPSVTLSRVMRSTANIYNTFKHFYMRPIISPSKMLTDAFHISDVTIGHHIIGPPIYWTQAVGSTDEAVAGLIIDLCTSKGFKPCELCVLPFFMNENIAPEKINRCINRAFVENAYQPNCIGDVEDYLDLAHINDFLIIWALKVKGLEFKVVVIIIENEDFDWMDIEDRKKVYMMTSRCTSLLIFIMSQDIREQIDVDRKFQCYPFSTILKMNEQEMESNPVSV